jgi:pimeloyl-ACP methyl ester carboxylesterase
MNMLAIILLQVECVLDLSITGLCHRMQNQNYSKTKLTMPVLTLQGGYIPVFGGNVTMSSIEYGMKQLAQNVTGITVPNSGHWIAEEQPVFLVKLLDKTSK